MIALTELSKIIRTYRESTIQSEAEVRSKFIVPLLEWLGYPSNFRSEEFPVYGYEGRKQLPAKNADYILFNDSKFESNRTRAGINWVKDHSLLVVEAKKPGEMTEDLGQPQYYTIWTKAVAYIETDGERIKGYFYNPIIADTEILDTKIDDLSKDTSIIKFRYQHIHKLKSTFESNADIPYNIQDFSEVKKYLSKLDSIYSEISKDYIPLSYYSEYDSTIALSVEELISYIYEEKRGLRITAEGGFGKTWSIIKLAKMLSDTARNSSKPSLIPIFIEIGKLYTGCSSIKDRIAQLLFEGDPQCVYTLFSNYRIVILLDGMDEATPKIQRNLKNEIDSYYIDYPNILWICASRKSCIEKYPVQLPCFKIHSMNDEQISRYLKQKVKPEYLEKAMHVWIGEERVEFLSQSRIPFYLSCYVQIVLVQAISFQLLR